VARRGSDDVCKPAGFDVRVDPAGAVLLVGLLQVVLDHERPQDVGDLVARKALGRTKLGHDVVLALLDVLVRDALREKRKQSNQTK